MKQANKIPFLRLLGLTVLLALELVVTGCVTPTPTPTPPTPTLTKPTPALTPILSPTLPDDWVLTAPPTVTMWIGPKDAPVEGDLVFLLDDTWSSTSWCRTDLDARVFVPEFLSSFLVYHPRILDDTKFQLGIYLFGYEKEDEARPLQGSASYGLQSLREFKQNSAWRDDLEAAFTDREMGHEEGYATPLSQVGAIFGNPDESRWRTLILITDGYFWKGTQNDRLVERKHPATVQLQALSDSHINVVVVLLDCPGLREGNSEDVKNYEEDLDYWRGRDKENLLELFELKSGATGFETIYQLMALDRLSRLAFIPQSEISGWGWWDGKRFINPAEEGVPGMAGSLPGDVASRQVWVLPVDRFNEQLQLELTPGPIPLVPDNGVYRLNAVDSQQVSVDSGCKRHDWTIARPNLSVLPPFVFWWKAAYPHRVPTVEITPKENFLNPSQLLITIGGGEAQGQSLDESIGKCYRGQINLTLKNGTSLWHKSIPQEAAWPALPIAPVDIPERFWNKETKEIRVEYYMIRANGASVGSASAQADLQYGLEVEVGNPSPSCSGDSCKLTFLTKIEEFGEVQVYYLGYPSVNACQSTGVPSSDANIRVIPNLPATAQVPEAILATDTGETEIAFTRKLSDTTWQYSLPFKENWFEQDCYNSILFQWVVANIEKTYQCDWNDNNDNTVGVPPSFTCHNNSSWHVSRVESQ